MTAVRVQQTEGLRSRKEAPALLLQFRAGMFCAPGGGTRQAVDAVQARRCAAARKLAAAASVSRRPGAADCQDQGPRRHR